MDIGGLRFSHLGLFACDIARMAAFYRDWLGFTETDRGHLDTERGRAALIFLSRDPDEHHQLVLVSGRPAQIDFNVVNQISLKADSLEGLLAHYRRLKEAPITDMAPVTHGNALSLYFRDPEGNRVELYVDTPWYVSQPMRVPAPFDAPADELLRWSEAHARKLPGFRPRAEWRRAMAVKMGVSE